MQKSGHGAGSSICSQVVGEEHGERFTYRKEPAIAAAGTWPGSEDPSHRAWFPDRQSVGPYRQ
jgi:hypothetical protein